MLGERIAEGVVLEGRLWLRGTMISQTDDSGGLVCLSLADGSREVHFDKGVFDIEKSGPNLWVLRRLSPTGHDLTVSTWSKDRFEDFPKFRSKDKPIALLNSGGIPIVLSEKTVRVFSPERKTWNSVPLKGKLRTGVQVNVATPSRGDSIYVGINIGEWGGGLQRVDPKTGAVTNIERRDSKELCAGPLNSDCDPVTGVIPDPLNPDCVLATIGLVHFFSGGRILRVCGERVTLVLEQPVAEDREYHQTEAFYGLAADGEGGFWAITWRAVYRFKADGSKEKEYQLPNLEPVCGVYLSREIPGVIVVRTDVNWAVSVSGYSPLVIPLAQEP